MECTELLALCHERYSTTYNRNCKVEPVLYHSYKIIFKSSVKVLILVFFSLAEDRKGTKVMYSTLWHKPNSKREVFQIAGINTEVLKDSKLV